MDIGAPFGVGPLFLPKKAHVKVSPVVQEAQKSSTRTGSTSSGRYSEERIGSPEHSAGAELTAAESTEQYEVGTGDKATLSG